MSGKKIQEFITNDSGQWWCWATRRWQAAKKPVMGALIEIQMASRSDPSAHTISEELPTER
jgi:uncharacterized protein (DUF2237 family)